MDCQQIMYWSVLQQCEGASVRFGTHGHGARGKQWEVSTAGIIQNCDPSLARPIGGRMPNMGGSCWAALTTSPTAASATCQHYIHNLNWGSFQNIC